MKYTKIPTDNLGTVAYYLLQITRGVFEWSGELFFCPFITLSDKKYPLRITTWNVEGTVRKKSSLPFIMHNTLWLFADPVNPITYTRTRQRSMDSSLGIDKETIVFKKGSTLIIKYRDTTHVLKFIKTISDSERNDIFNPNDSNEIEFRTGIWKTSKRGNSSTYKIWHRNTWVSKYEEYRKQLRENTKRSVVLA